MKKLGIVLVLAMLLIGVSFSLPACKNKGKPFSADMLKNAKVNLDGVKAVGMQKKARTSGASVRGTAYAADDAKQNFLVTFDESNNIKDVVFLFENSEKKHEQLPGYLGKVYVTDEFVYLQYYFNNRSVPDLKTKPDAMYTDYRCSSTDQAFVIHKETGKVYSLRQAGEIIEIHNNILFTCENMNQDKKYVYKLTVENNELKLTDLAPNKSITISGVLSDKWGQALIINNAIETSQNGVIFIIGESSADCALGTDGQIYRRTSNNVSKFLNKNGVFETVTSENRAAVVKAYNGNFYMGYFVINGSIFESSWIYKVAGRNGTTVLPGFDIENCTVLPLGDKFIILSQAKQLIEIDIDKAFGEDGALIAEGSEYDPIICALEGTLLAENISTICSQPGQLLFYKETTTSTTTMRVYVKDGAVTIEALSDTSYEAQIITVQPLN